MKSSRRGVMWSGGDEKKFRQTWPSLIIVSEGLFGLSECLSVALTYRRRYPRGAKGLVCMSLVLLRIPRLPSKLMVYVEWCKSS